MAERLSRKAVPPPAIIHWPTFALGEGAGGLSQRTHTMGNMNDGVTGRPVVVCLNKGIVARMSNTGLHFNRPEGIGT